MPVLIQVDFPKSGPFGAEMVEKFRDVAESISAQPGLIWKIWGENEEEGRAAGLYLFEDQATADAYLEMHVPRLKSQGFSDIRAKMFDVNEGLTKITRGPV